MTDPKIAQELMCLTQKYPGKRPLELHIKSKLADVIIESKIKVNENIIQEAKGIGAYIEERLVTEE